MSEIFRIAAVYLYFLHFLWKNSLIIRFGWLSIWWATITRPITRNRLSNIRSFSFTTPPPLPGSINRRKWTKVTKTDKTGASKWPKVRPSSRFHFRAPHIDADSAWLLERNSATHIDVPKSSFCMHLASSGWSEANIMCVQYYILSVAGCVWWVLLFPLPRLVVVSLLVSVLALVWFLLPLLEPISTKSIPVTMVNPISLALVYTVD